MSEIDKIDRYEIERELGHGGMATVFLAQDPRFDRQVAVKVLPREFLHDKKFRERFDREAKSIAKLEHSTIVPVYDYGEFEGQPFIVMRYLAGGSLKDRMEQGTLSTPEILDIISRIADALQEAHLQGIIHRDLKPGNILFDARGNAYLADFGIAKLSEATAQLTGSALIGTPAYMSPEQVHGDQTIDGRSDVYSLGIIMYELLAGKKPYDADTPAKLVFKHVLDPIPNILEDRADLPDGLKDVTEKALAKDRDERYDTPIALSSAVSKTLMAEAGFAREKVERVEAKPAAAPAALSPEKEPAPAVRQPARPPVLETEYTHDALAEEPAPLKKETGVSSRIPGWGWVLGGVIVSLILFGLLSGIEFPTANQPRSAGSSDVADEDISELEHTEVSEADNKKLELGTEENPLIWVLVPSEDSGTVLAGADEIAARLEDETGLVMETFVSTDFTGAVEAMCSGEAHIGALNTYNYLLASARNCATVGVASIRFGSTFYAGQLVTRADSGIESIADLAGKTFCRPDPTSTSGWVIPSINMKAAGLDPERDLAEIVDAGGHDGVIKAVYNGDCDAGSSYVDARGTIEEEYPDVMDVVIVLEESPPIPNDNISYSPDVSAEDQATLTAFFMSLTYTDEGLALLEGVYNWGGLAAVEDSFYDGFRQVLEAAGVSIQDLIDG